MNLIEKVVNAHNRTRAIRKHLHRFPDLGKRSASDRGFHLRQADGVGYLRHAGYRPDRFGGDAEARQ